MPKVVKANGGDTLCGIGIDNGFLDCAPMRAANAGQDFLNRPLQYGDMVTVPDLTTSTESKSATSTATFVKKSAPPVRIRFVHGSPDKHYLEDDDLLFLAVSKFQVDKGGATGASAVPDQCEFQQAAHVDLATFKVEIVDPAAGGTVQAKLEALEPVYQSDHVTVDHWKLFEGAEYAKRKLDVECAQVHSGVAYRSKYLRLVADEADKDGTVGPVAPNGFAPGPGSPKPDQSLLVTDMVDQGEPDVEILDQRVRATYTIDRCTGSPQCCVTAELPVGDDRQRLRLFVHVMRRTPGGAPVVSLDDAKRRVLKWSRRIFAQSSIAPRIVGIQEEDPVENMIMIADPGGPPTPGANAGGSSASGVDSTGAPSQIRFRIKAADGTEQLVGPITPVDPGSGAGFTPIQTANALAALVQPPFTATATANPRRSNDAQGSADIVIHHNAGQFITFGVADSSDTAQTLDVANINPLPAPQRSWDGFNFLAGSPDQRIMLKNYDTGTDRIDVFVVDSTSDGNRGEAMIHGHAITSDATRQAIDCVRSSLFVIQTTMNSGDSDPLVLSHEAGHVTGEVGHAQGVRTELMFAQVTGNNAVGSSKRLTARGVAYDLTSGGLFDINQRMRSEGGAAGLLEGW